MTNIQQSNNKCQRDTKRKRNAYILDDKSKIQRMTYLGIDAGIDDFMNIAGMFLSLLVIFFGPAMASKSQEDQNLAKHIRHWENG